MLAENGRGAFERTLATPFTGRTQLSSSFPGPGLVRLSLLCLCFPCPPQEVPSDSPQPQAYETAVWLHRDLPVCVGEILTRGVHITRPIARAHSTGLQGRRQGLNVIARLERGTELQFVAIRTELALARGKGIIDAAFLPGGLGDDKTPNQAEGARLPQKFFPALTGVAKTKLFILVTCLQRNLRINGFTEFGRELAGISSPLLQRFRQGAQ